MKNLASEHARLQGVGGGEEFKSGKILNGKKIQKIPITYFIAKP